MSLLVDPGSNTFVSARFPRFESVAEAALLGSKVGAVASARISPVRGSITTMVPLSAWDCATRFAIAC